MLERAARCLNPGGRQTSKCLRSPSASGTLQSRRNLHSTFWRHGAGDLDLPSWACYVTRVLFEPDHITAHGNKQGSVVASSSSNAVDRPMFLDFLYPERTKAMIRRLSVYGYRTWRRHTRRLSVGVAHRNFTSNAVGAQRVVHTELSEGAEGDISQRDIPFIAPEKALETLQELIECNAREEYRESWTQAWDCYHNLGPLNRTSDLKHGLIDVLSKSPRSRDWRRLLHIFGDIDTSERRREGYFHAVVANLKIKDTPQAIALHLEALKRLGVEGNVGTDVLLAHLIGDNQWELIHPVWNNIHLYSGSNSTFQNWQHSFETKLAAMPGVHQKALSLMSHINSGRVNEAELTVQCAIFLSLVRSVLKKGTGFGTRRNVQVLEFLKHHGLSEYYFYETLCFRTLEGTRQDMAARMAQAHKIYHMYRNDDTCIGYKKSHSTHMPKDGTFQGEQTDYSSSAPSFEPSRKLLHAMIKSAVEIKDVEYALVLLADWQRFYGDPPSVLTGLVIRGLARSGDITSAEHMLRNYISRQQGGDNPVNVRLFHPLLQFHAERGDPKAVLADFELVKEYTLPDATCWNILLHAHEKADDLDGVISALSSMLDAGVPPDAFTIGTVMAAAADRGDVDLCEQMLNTAAENSINRTPIMNDCMVRALLRDGQEQKAQVFATSMTTTMPALPSIRMWNSILTHHALSSRTRVLPNTLKVASKMQSLKVRFNTYTYAALMRAYVVKRKPDLARRVLEKTMHNNVQPTALHYAILVDGYADLRSFEKGLRMHAEMLERGITPDRSSQIALQRLLLLAGRARIAQYRGKIPGLRSDVFDELLEELIPTLGKAVTSSGSPELYSSYFRGTEGDAAALFDLPLSFYSDVRAFDVVKTLLDRYEAIKGNADDHTIPLRFLAHMMNIRYREGNFAEVDRYWELATAQARQSSKLATRSGSSYLPRHRRYVLTKHVDIYFRSLAAREPGGRSPASAIFNAIKSLYDLGLDLDNMNWNLYVQILATRGDHLKAFSLCEQNLMKAFPAEWQAAEPRVRFYQASRTKSPGTEFLGRRYTFLKPGELRATYKTMVRFALVLRTLRQEAPYSLESKRKLDDIEAKAPQTVKAVLDMPMVDHPVATHVLGGRVEAGRSRSLE